MNPTWLRVKEQWPVILLALAALGLTFVWRAGCKDAIPVPYVAASIMVGSLLVAIVLRAALLASRPAHTATVVAGCVGVVVAMGVGWAWFITNFARCFEF